MLRVRVAKRIMLVQGAQTGRQPGRVRLLGIAFPGGALGWTGMARSMEVLDQATTMQTVHEILFEQIRRDRSTRRR